jgi:hypothetical protein
MSLYPPIIEEVVYGKVRRSMVHPHLSGPTPVDFGHLHPVVESFEFRKLARGHYDVKDDYGYWIGNAIRTGSGWAGYHLGRALLDSDGGPRIIRRRRDVAYRLLCVALGCPALAEKADRPGIDSEASR